MLLPSAVHVSSTFESGASQMSLPSAVHVSSTIESGAQQKSLPSVVRQLSILQSYSETHEFIAKRCSCVLHHRVWSPANSLPSAVRQFYILHFFLAPGIYCLALFMCPPPSSLELRELIA